MIGVGLHTPDVPENRCAGQKLVKIKCDLQETTFCERFMASEK